MYIGKIEDAVKLLEQTAANFTEMERQQIAWYAFKTGDDELTQKLIEELSEDDRNRENIMQKYLAIADREVSWIEQIEMLLVSIEMLRLKEKQALELLSKMVKAYGKEIAEKENAEAERNARKTETEKSVEEKRDQQKVM